MPLYGFKKESPNRLGSVNVAHMQKRHQTRKSVDAAMNDDFPPDELVVPIDVPEGDCKTGGELTSLEAPVSSR